MNMDDACVAASNAGVRSHACHDTAARNPIARSGKAVGGSINEAWVYAGSRSGIDADFCICATARCRTVAEPVVLVWKRIAPAHHLVQNESR